MNGQKRALCFKPEYQVLHTLTLLLLMLILSLQNKRTKIACPAASPAPIYIDHSERKNSAYIFSRKERGRQAKSMFTPSPGKISRAKRAINHQRVYSLYLVRRTYMHARCLSQRHKVLRKKGCIELTQHVRTNAISLEHSDTDRNTDKQSTQYSWSSIHPAGKTTHPAKKKGRKKARLKKTPRNIIVKPHFLKTAAQPCF